jgi:endonuclease/exonuclease/phosphatase family metal-dependent hydrolase
MSNRVRVATYNIHKSRGLDWRVRPDRIVEVLREIHADIVALQEVVSAPDIRGEDQAQFIATELGYHSCFGENRRLNGAPYSNLLLSRFHMRASCNHDISTDGRERRGCLRADIAMGETTLHVFNVHLARKIHEFRNSKSLFMVKSCC